jgi:hypothetical protein
MQKSVNHYDADMAMIRIQASKWVQGTIQDLILNNVTTDWPVYDFINVKHLSFEVMTIEKIDGYGKDDYKYNITFKDHRGDNNGQNEIERTIKAKRVILAAGTLGSTEILRRSKKQGKLDISDTIGTRFSTNGDMFGVINLLKR